MPTNDFDPNDSYLMGRYSLTPAWRFRLYSPAYRGAMDRDAAPLVSGDTGEGLWLLVFFGAIAFGLYVESRLLMETILHYAPSAISHFLYRTAASLPQLPYAFALGVPWPLLIVGAGASFAANWFKYLRWIKLAAIYFVMYLSWLLDHAGSTEGDAFVTVGIVIALALYTVAFARSRSG